MKFGNIMKETLFEEKQEKMKIFYSSDILIRRTENQIQSETEQDSEEEVQAQESTSIRNELLTEETFRSKSEGMINVPESEARTILTLDDLLVYISRQKVSGKEIINELIIEVINVLIEGQPQQVEELIFKSDKINFTLDYGFNTDDSIGLQLNKNLGVDEASLVIRKNGSPAAGKFDPNLFKQKITTIFLPEL